jgi:hypothetical protein
MLYECGKIETRILDDTLFRSDKEYLYLIK